jgi:hypothetical protein
MLSAVQNQNAETLFGLILRAPLSTARVLCTCDAINVAIIAIGISAALVVSFAVSSFG